MKLFLCLALVFNVGFLKADYVPPALNELILKADGIVYGKIVCQDKSVIEIKVGGSVTEHSGSISIDKFKEWNCGKRWADYKLGDRSIFFLRLKNGRYQTMGGGNEGELPIQEEKVYVHASTISRQAVTGRFERSTLFREDYGFNNPYNGYTLNFKALWQAIGIIRKCFTSEVTATGKLINVQQGCPSEDYESIRIQNQVWDWTLEELMGLNPD